MVKWWFPKIGVAPNHPFVHGIFHFLSHLFWDSPIYGTPQMMISITFWGTLILGHVQNFIGAASGNNAEKAGRPERYQIGIPVPKPIQVFQNFPHGNQEVPTMFSLFHDYQA